MKRYRRKPPTAPMPVVNTADAPFHAPADDYNPRKDLAGSIAEGFKAIRERVAKGGEGWKRK